MVRKGYYSPALRRDLVRRLYFQAQDLRIPMTVLNDRIVEEALDRMATIKFLTVPSTIQEAKAVA